ncbi:hypothetical protein Fcan01_26559 [Folsomia candida]|uniref:Uncharacterized protein n=1 Tax=Folsomia candida TaxID=158441 RepID=A0A226D1N5_FOLCA|nr:hypothetical protein Fcan01_26559 [Folsomia candida]
MTQQCLILFDTFLEILAFPGGSAVRFDSRRKLFYTTRLTKFKATLAGTLLFAQFISSSIQCLFIDPAETFEFNLCVVIVFSITLPLTAYIPHIFQPREMVRVCNLTSNYAETFKRNWTLKQDDNGRSTLFYVYLVIAIVSTWYYFVGSFTTYFWAELPIGWTLLISRKSKHYKTVLVMFMAFASFCLYITVAVLVVLVYFFIWMSALLIPIHSTEFNATLPAQKYSTHPHFRHPTNLPLEYRKFQILHLHVMQVVGLFLIPFQAIATNFVLYTNFVTGMRWITRKRT